MPTLFTLLAASTLPISPVPVDQFAQYGPTWLLLAGVVGAILVILGNAVKSLVAKKNGVNGKCKADLLGPVLQDLRVTIGALGVKVDGLGDKVDGLGDPLNRLADAVTQFRLDTAAGVGEVNGKCESILGTLAATPTRRKAGK